MTDVTEEMIEAGVSYIRSVGGSVSAIDLKKLYLKMHSKQPPVEGDDVEERLNEILRGFHYETFRAGVCYERDDWPQTDEEWTELDQSIQSEAVGEHYEGWAPETLENLRAALASLPPPNKDKLLELADSLTPLERELLLGESDGWGSWMFECGAGLCAKGLGRRDNGSIYFDTPLAKDMIAHLRSLATGKEQG